MFDIFITNPRCYRVMQQRPTDLTQWTKYKTVNRELTGDQFTAHLQGEKTLSASLVHQEQAQAMGLDIDAGGLDAGLRALREAHAMGIHAIFIYEPGNVGGHDGGMLWAKLNAPAYWKRAWTLMDDLRDRAELTNAEAFPNPLPFRLPFGVNLGCDPPTRGILYTQDGQAINLDSDDWHHQAAPIWNSLTPYPTAALPEAPEPVTPQVAIRCGDIKPLDEQDIIGLYNTHLEIEDLVELLERNSDYRRARWNYRTGGAIMHCGCGNHQHHDRTPSLELRPATTDIRRGWNIIGHTPTCEHHPTVGKVKDPFNILLDQHGGNHRTAMREARQLVNAKRRDSTQRRDTSHPPESHGGSGSNGETGSRACHTEEGGTKNLPNPTAAALPPPYQPPTTAPLATLVKNDDAPADPAPTHTPHPIEAYIQAHGTDSDYYLYRAYCDLGRDATNTQLNAHIAQHRLRPYSTGHLRRSKMKFWQLIREWEHTSTSDQNDHLKVYIDHDHVVHDSWTCNKQESSAASVGSAPTPLPGFGTRQSSRGHGDRGACGLSAGGWRSEGAESPGRDSSLDGGMEQGTCLEDHPVGGATDGEGVQPPPSVPGTPCDDARGSGAVVISHNGPPVCVSASVAQIATRDAGPAMQLRHKSIAGSQRYGGMGTSERDVARCPPANSSPSSAATLRIAQEGVARSDPTRPVCKTGYSRMEEGPDRAQSRGLPMQDSTGALPLAHEVITAEVITADIRSQRGEASKVWERPVATSNGAGDDTTACTPWRVQGVSEARDLSVVTGTRYDTPELQPVPMAAVGPAAIGAPTAEYSAPDSFPLANGSGPGASYREPKRRPLPKDPKLRAMEQQRRRCVRYAAMSLDDLHVTYAKLKGAARKARGRRQKALEHQVSSVEQIIARKRGTAMEAMLMVNPDAERGETLVQLHTPPAEGPQRPPPPPASVQAHAENSAPSACVLQVQSAMVAAEDDGGVLRPVYRGLKRATPSIAYSKGVHGTPVPHRPVLQRRAETDPNDPWVQLQRSMLAKAEREGNTERAAWYRQVLANVGIAVPESESAPVSELPTASGQLGGVLVGHVNPVVSENVSEVVPRLPLGVPGTGPVLHAPVHLAPEKPLGKIPPEPVQSLRRNPQSLTRLADRVLQPSGTGSTIAPQVVVASVGQCLNRAPELLPSRAVQVVADRSSTTALRGGFPHPNAPVLPIHIIGFQSGDFVVSEATRGDGVKHLQLLITALGVFGHRLPDFLDGRVVIAPAHTARLLAPHIGGHERALVTGPAACTPERVKLAECGEELINRGAAQVFAPLLLAALPECGNPVSNRILVDVFDILRSVLAGQGPEQTIDSPAIAAGRFVTVDVPVVGSIRFVVVTAATFLEIEHAANLMTHTRTFRHRSLLSLMVRGPPWDDAGWVGEKPPASVSPPSPPLSPPTVV